MFASPPARLRRWAAAAVLGLAAICATPATPVAEAAGYHVTIRRTAHGIPHIVAGDYGSLGYGYAYAFAQDAICTMADQYVTVDARRSAVFGPAGSYDFSQSNGSTPNNLDSDVFWAKIIKQRTVEKLVAEPPSRGGPLPEVDKVVRGYVAGWNRYLKDVGGAKGVRDPACHGKPWVKPITRIEVYRRFYQLALLASSGVAIDGIANAAPVGPGVPALAARRKARAAAASPALDAHFRHVLGGLGSNAIALGSAATGHHGGLLLGNPHFPWDGAQRFYESQVTVPGKINVAGASLYGAPVINIGFTRGLAWSHTVSTARRFNPYQLQLVPGDPHAYLVDGAVKHMTPTTVTVQSRQPDGSLKPVTRTLYDTQYGPMFTTIAGQPLFPWTSATGFALYDANAQNFGRLFNHFFDTNRAQSVAKLDAIERKWQGIPWVNTIAADRTGHAYYADIGSMPNIDEAKRTSCETALGTALDQAARIQVLDGSRGACAPGSAPGAAAAGILPPSKQPVLRRSDYVTNSNDSYWLSNPLQPLEGYPRVIGDERTTRTPRTRLGLRIVQQRLDGTDGLGTGGAFTPKQLMHAVFNDRQYLGELWRDELVKMCDAHPTIAGSNGPVDVSRACPVLAAWSKHDNLASRGALLFRRFAARAIAVPNGPFTTPFSASDPVNTPRGLNTDDPQIQRALADAVTDVLGAGQPLDGTLGAAQYDVRDGTRIPIHGGPDELGLFNVISSPWDPKGGYHHIVTGSSYVQVVKPAKGCPNAHTILTYSESPDPTSKWHADQTRMFSKKQWVTWPFCDRQVAADPKLRLRNLGGGYRGYAQTGTSARLLRRVTVRRADGRTLRIGVRTAARTLVTVRLTRGKRTLRLRRIVVGPKRARSVTLHGLSRGAVRVRVRARGIKGGRSGLVARRARV